MDNQQDGNKVDERVINKILTKIIVKENKNLKTKEMSDAEMVKTIQKIIQEEVECY